MKTKDTTPGKRGPKFLYPWDKWYALSGTAKKGKPRKGKLFVIKRGKDFDCTMRTMIVSLYRKARWMNVFVSVQEVGNDKLQFQAYEE